MISQTNCKAWGFYFFILIRLSLTPKIIGTGHLHLNYDVPFNS